MGNEWRYVWLGLTIASTVIGVGVSVAEAHAGTTSGAVYAALYAVVSAGSALYAWRAIRANTAQTKQQE